MLHSGKMYFNFLFDYFKPTFSLQKLIDAYVSFWAQNVRVFHIYNLLFPSN